MYLLTYDSNLSFLRLLGTLIFEIVLIEQQKFSSIIGDE